MRYFPPVSFEGFEFVGGVPNCVDVWFYVERRVFLWDSDVFHVVVALFGVGVPGGVPAVWAGCVFAGCVAVGFVWIVRLGVLPCVSAVVACEPFGVGDFVCGAVVFDEVCWLFHGYR